MLPREYGYSVGVASDSAIIIIVSGPLISVPVWDRATRQSLIPLKKYQRLCFSTCFLFCTLYLFLLTVSFVVIIARFSRFVLHCCQGVPIIH